MRVLETIMEPSERSRKRGKKYLSIEMILRKSFKDCVKEYVNNCSLPGVRQMCDPKFGTIHRFMWFIIFCIGLSTCCYFLVYTWQDTLTRPFIINLESSTYPISEVEFPAVALCNINRISKKALQQLAEKEYPDIARGESLEEVKNVLLTLGSLIDFSYNESLSNNPILVRFVEKYRTDSVKILDIMRKLAPNCDEMLIKCSWGGALVDCKTIFTTRHTAFGDCCTFNYVANYNTKSMKKAIADIKRQNEHGNHYGLNLVLDPKLYDYAYPMSPMEGFDVLIFSPLNFPEPRSGRTIRRIAEPNSVLYLELKSTKQIAKSEIRKYSVETRRCLFHDERKAEFAYIYSYSACLVLCRVKIVRSLCKCTPYNMAMNSSMRKYICSLDRLKCLNKYKGKLMYVYPMNTKDITGLEMEFQDSTFCDECLPDCELTQHYTKEYKTKINQFDDKDFTFLLIKEINMTDKGLLSIFHSVPHNTLTCVDVVYYWYEVLCNIGGFCGLTMGYSFFSVAEMFYFLTVRFTQNLSKNFKLYR